MDDVTIDGGKLTGCNTAAQTVHGAGLVYNGRAGFSVTNVTMSNLVITGTPAAAGRNLGVIKDMATATVTGVVFRNIALDGTLTAVGGNARASWTATGFTRNGQPITP